MKEEWNDVFFAPINEDGSYGEIGHISYKGEPVENCGLISFKNCLDITIVGRAVIRCKDCKYWDVDNDVGFCTRTEDCDWSADDFCSRGEKR